MLKPSVLLVMLSFLFLAGCGNPRKLPKTPAAYSFPPPIYTPDFPAPEKIMGLNLRKLRKMRPEIERVYHSAETHIEFEEILTAHPYFANVSYFISTRESIVKRIVYRENSEVYLQPAHRLALIKKLSEKFGQPIRLQDGKIMLFKSASLLLLLYIDCLEVLPLSKS